MMLNTRAAERKRNIFATIYPYGLNEKNIYINSSFLTFLLLRIKLFNPSFLISSFTFVFVFCFNFFLYFRSSFFSFLPQSSSWLSLRYISVPRISFTLTLIVWSIIFYFCRLFIIFLSFLCFYYLPVLFIYSSLLLIANLLVYNN